MAPQSAPLSQIHFCVIATHCARSLLSFVPTSLGPPGTGTFSGDRWGANCDLAGKSEDARQSLVGVLLVCDALDAASVSGDRTLTSRWPRCLRCQEACQDACNHLNALEVQNARNNSLLACLDRPAGPGAANLRQPKLPTSSNDRIALCQPPSLLGPLAEGFRARWKVVLLCRGRLLAFNRPCVDQSRRS
jgi:hypothetical protein